MPIRGWDPEGGRGGTKGEKIRIQRLGDTKILEVSYNDSDKNKIKFVLDKLAEAYIKYGRESTQNNTGEGLNFVEEQIPKYQQKIKSYQIIFLCIKMRCTLSGDA